MSRGDITTKTTEITLHLMLLLTTTPGILKTTETTGTTERTGATADVTR